MRESWTEGCRAGGPEGRREERRDGTDGGMERWRDERTEGRKDEGTEDGEVEGNRRVKKIYPSCASRQKTLCRTKSGIIVHREYKLAKNGKNPKIDHIQEALGDQRSGDSLPEGPKLEHSLESRSRVKGIRKGQEEGRAQGEPRGRPKRVRLGEKGARRRGRP